MTSTECAVVFRKLPPGEDYHNRRVIVNKWLIIQPQWKTAYLLTKPFLLFNNRIIRFVLSRLP